MDFCHLNREINACKDWCPVMEAVGRANTRVEKENASGSVYISML